MVKADERAPNMDFAMHMDGGGLKGSVRRITLRLLCTVMLSFFFCSGNINIYDTRFFLYFVRIER
jgi:hypothetical protein